MQLEKKWFLGLAMIFLLCVFVVDITEYRVPSGWSYLPVDTARVAKWEYPDHSFKVLDDNVNWATMALNCGVRESYEAFEEPWLYRITFNWNRIHENGQELIVEIGQESIKVNGVNYEVSDMENVLWSLKFYDEKHLSQEMIYIDDTDFSPVSGSVAASYPFVEGMTAGYISYIGDAKQGHRPMRSNDGGTVPEYLNALGLYVRAAETPFDGNWKYRMIFENLLAYDERGKQDPQVYEVLIGENSMEYNGVHYVLADDRDFSEVVEKFTYFYEEEFGQWDLTTEMPMGEIVIPEW